MPEEILQPTPKIVTEEIAAPDLDKVHRDYPGGIFRGFPPYWEGLGPVEFDED